MAELEQFVRQVEGLFAAGREGANRQPARTAQLMAEFKARRLRFEEIARRLVDGVIRPRVEVVASRFPNAQVVKIESGDGCLCRFGYCERFPSNAKCEIAVDHDERVEQLVVRCERYMRPTYLKFDEQDEFETPLDKVDEGIVANWVEAKLLAFVEAYLQLDRGDDDAVDEIVVDPVCGMRVSCSSAAAKMDYKGHPYYFCTDECR